MAELVDALDLGSSGATRGSSSLPFRTTRSLASPQLAVPRELEEIVVTTQSDTLDVSIEGRKGLERQMTVRVPADEIEREVDTRLKKVRRTARLKGFRPGKIPPKIVRQRFGGQIRSEVVSDVIRTSYAQAVRQEQLQPAGGPRIEPLSAGSDQHFSFRATFEVFPEIKLKPVVTLSVEFPKVEVVDSDVDRMLETVREQRAEWHPVERKSAGGDRVVVDFTGTVDGTPFEGGEGEEVGVVVGSGQVVADLDKALKKVTAGQSKTAKVKFPKDYPAPHLAGKRTVFEISVHRVEEKHLPEVDAAFLQAMGVEEGGVDALRAELRNNMERELNERLRAASRAAAFDALLRVNKIDVPKALVQQEVADIQAEAMRRLGLDDAEKAPPASNFEAPARRRVALSLLVREVIAEYGIELDRSRVNERIAELSAPYEEAQRVAQAYRSNPELMEQIEFGVLEDQVAEYIVEHAKSREKSMGFREFMG